MNWFPLPHISGGQSCDFGGYHGFGWGVVVFCFMNLRFGWVFSGLVVSRLSCPTYYREALGCGHSDRGSDAYLLDGDGADKINASLWSCVFFSSGGIDSWR